MDPPDTGDHLSSGLAALRDLWADPAALDEHRRLEAMVSGLDALVTDAQLHPCAADVALQLRSALWSAAGGFGMSALSAASQALHLGTAALTLSASGRPPGKGEARPIVDVSLPTYPDVFAWLEARALSHTPLPQGVRTPAAQVQRLVIELRAGALVRPSHASVCTALSEVIDTLAALWLLERPRLRARPLGDGFFEHDWARAVRATWTA
jgi:hypothetical protein